MAERGKYIIIEGNDGTGKTTQADLLKKYLEGQGKEVIHVNEPGGSPVNEAIRSVIVNGSLERRAMTNVLLFTANRHELWHSVILPALERGVWVVATRNHWSTLVYQGYAEGADVDLISEITQMFTSKEYMQPDRAVMLHFPDEASRKERVAQRGDLENPDTFEARSGEFQRRIENGYEAVAKAYSIPMVDASRSIDEIQIDIRKLIEEL